MTHPTRLLGACCLALLALGCTANGGVKEMPPPPPVDPEDPPREFTLFSPVPVLVATFEATESGYTVSLAQALAAPSPTIDQSRDVVVRALGADGEPLATVSVFNPRDVHTAGSSQPDRAVRESGSFTVAFARPEAIRALEVEVVRGANEGLEASFPVDLEDVPREDPYRQQ